MRDESHGPDHAEPRELDGLDWAVDALREIPSVTPEWRRQLLASLPRHRPSRRLAMHPMVALAAGLVCVVLGAAGQRWAMSSRSEPSASTAPRDGAVALRSVASDPGMDEDRIGVRFAVVAPGAQRVSVVGDFNRWDASATPLARSRDGNTWTTMIPLRAGRHTYAFVIDGDVVPDPSAPPAADDDFGIPNSVILVMRSP
jgi:Carbohydrate-binding module 48 (Isoamylase N-terminal domain)